MNTSKKEKEEARKKIIAASTPKKSTSGSVGIGSGKKKNDAAKALATSLQLAEDSDGESSIVNNAEYPRDIDTILDLVGKLTIHCR